MRVTTQLLPVVPAVLAVAALSAGALAAGPASASPGGHPEHHHTVPGTLTPRPGPTVSPRPAAAGWAGATRERPRPAARGPRALVAQPVPPGPPARRPRRWSPGSTCPAIRARSTGRRTTDQGKRFTYVKATEGSSYTNPDFSPQYGGAVDAGLLHGAYHFANPGGEPGGVQASYFIAHGGGWTDNAKTLPGALDIEYNPYAGGVCYGLSASAMRTWISNFLTRYKNVTGRPAVIYTTTDWWTRCTGNTSAFSKTNVLWIARYASQVGTLPSGWGSYGFWQYSDDPVDQDRFFAGLPRLHKFAAG